MLFGNFQIIIKTYVDKRLEKRCREIIESNLNDTQCGFRPGHSNTDHISLSSKILKNIGSMLKTSSHALSTSRSIRPGSLWKALGSVEWTRCWRPLLAAKSLYSCSDVCVRVGRVKSRPFTVVLDSNNGVCCHRPFSQLTLVVQLFRWRESNPDQRLCWRDS